MSITYYNEFDHKSAEWLRQLIDMKVISYGVVDERSITEVTASDLIGFDRCHFFAGVGTWDYCLNQSGWGDRSVWTASLPCQPFSAAGKGRGKDDERHLLPHFLELVKEREPDTIIGEQVERAIAHGWLDDLQANMEAEGYAVGHCVLGAHSIGSPHIRQRLYWLAERMGNTESDDQQWGGQSRSCIGQQIEIGGSSVSDCGMVYADERGSQPGIETTEIARQGRSVESTSCVERMADSVSEQREQQPDERPSSVFGAPIQSEECVSGLGDIRATSDIDWIYCRDNKYRPIKSSIQPLVDGATGRMVCGSNPSAPINANNTQEARVMRLKGYGNAIQAQTAIAFITAYMSI